MQSFSYTEFSPAAPNGILDTETASRLNVLQLQAMYAPLMTVADRDLPVMAQVRYRMTQGDTRYDGYWQQGGNLTPHRDVTGNRFEDWQVRVGVSLARGDVMLTPFAAFGGHDWRRDLAQYREDFRHEQWQAGLAAGWRWRPGLEWLAELSAGRMRQASIAVPALGFAADLGRGAVREAAAGLRWRVTPSSTLELRAERQSFDYGASAVVNGFMEPESRTVRKQVLVSLGYGI